jgi:hypothetical protein
MRNTKLLPTMTVALFLLTFSLSTETDAKRLSNAKPTLKEGVYRVDWNRKVRDLCVDFYTNEDLTAKDWQGVLGAQGVLCKLSEVKPGKSRTSWVGACHHPWVGKVANITHRVSLETKTDGSFEVLTVISGDLQATIPIRGEPLRAANGSMAKCEKEHAPFRPWQ